jgi:acetyl esterase/lipase
MRSRLIFLAFLFMALQSCSHKDPEFINPSVYNLSYGPDSLQKLDVEFSSGGPGLKRCVILIHGGGWSSGDKSSCSYFSSVFSQHGYVAVPMNYRLAGGKIRLKEILDDIASAIFFVKSHSKEWEIDTNSMNLFGHSAGAHLALLFAYKYSGLLSVKNVISLASATDLNDSLLLAIPGNPEAISTLTGDTTENLRKEASPVFYAGTASVPSLLVHGKSDPYFPFSQSVLLHDKLEAAGVRNRIVLFGNEGHELYPPFLTDEDADLLWQEIFSFLQEPLYGPSRMSAF